MSACAADIVPPSGTTAAGTAIARNVRPLLRIAGSLRVAGEPATRYLHVVFTLPHRWCHWCCRTKRSSTISYSVPVRKPLSKSLATRDAWVRKFVSSVSCTLGAKSSPLIRMSIVSCRPAASHWIAPGWVHSRDNYFLPRKCYRKFFAASSSTLSSRLFRMASSASMET